jgi:hypothetical protein
MTSSDKRLLAIARKTLADVKARSTDKEMTSLLDGTDVVLNELALRCDRRFISNTTLPAASS